MVKTILTLTRVGELDPLVHLDRLAGQAVEVPDVDAVHLAGVHVGEQALVGGALDLLVGGLEMST